MKHDDVYLVSFLPGEKRVKKETMFEPVDHERIEPTPRKRWEFDWRSYWLGITVATLAALVVSHVQ